MSDNRRNRSSAISRFFSSLYLTNRLFIILALLIVLACFAAAFEFLFFILQLCIIVLVALVILDIVILFSSKSIEAERKCAERFSNGDENHVALTITNRYNFPVKLTILDELPYQFQMRDLSFLATLRPKQTATFDYTLLPKTRGNYHFGCTNIYVETILSLVRRRYIDSKDQVVKVYPSFFSINKYALSAKMNNLFQIGQKKIRKIGNATEFEQIQNYNIGDDPRTINYKATARRNELMINKYVEERSQPVYCIIDKGRAMEMPFNGMSLLDYAINSTIVLAASAINKSDKFGLITFSNTIDTVLPASDKRTQMNAVLEVLYKDKTNFKDASYSDLFMTVKRVIKQRSLLVFYTNFETLNSLKRQIKYLKLLSRSHVVVVAFFVNQELEALLDKHVDNEYDIYDKAMAEKTFMDKQLIAEELRRHGIQTVLTSPENMTIATLNKYLEIKSRGIL